MKHEMGVLTRAIFGDISDKGPLGLIKLECVLLTGRISNIYI